MEQEHSKPWHLVVVSLMVGALYGLFHVVFAEAASHRALRYNNDYSTEAMAIGLLLGLACLWLWTAVFGHDTPEGPGVDARVLSAAFGLGWVVMFVVMTAAGDALIPSGEELDALQQSMS